MRIALNDHLKQVRNMCETPVLPEKGRAKIRHRYYYLHRILTLVYLKFSRDAYCNNQTSHRIFTMCHDDHKLKVVTSRLHLQNVGPYAQYLCMHFPLPSLALELGEMEIALHIIPETLAAHGTPGALLGLSG